MAHYSKQYMPTRTISILTAFLQEKKYFYDPKFRDEELKF